MKICYRYVNREGRKKSGVVEAASMEEARELLSNNGTYVISMRQKKSWLKTSRDFNKADLALFTTQLSHLLNAGIPLYESLLSLQEQYAQENFSPSVAMLCDEIKEGSTLAEAMATLPGSFDRLYISMIEAGEAAGCLSATLEKLALLLRRQNRLKRQLLTALLYPLILLSFSSILIVILLTFVVPSLEALFMDMRVNGFTRFVFGVSHLITHFWLPFSLLFFGGGAAAYFYFGSKRGQQFWHRFVLRLPLVKTVLIQTAIARFCRTMGTLLEGGVSIISALQIARCVIRQPQLEQSIEKAEARIIEGSLLSIELKKVDWVPSLVPRMLSVGEEGGNMASMLGRVADLYEDEVEKLLTRLATLAQPVILLFLGVVVGFIMLAILLPLTDVSGFMNGGL